LVMLAEEGRKHGFLMEQLVRILGKERKQDIMRWMKVLQQIGDEEWKNDALKYWTRVAELGDGKRVTPDMLIQLAEEGKAKNYFLEQVASIALREKSHLVDWLRTLQVIISDQEWKTKADEYWNYVAKLGSPEGSKITPQMLWSLLNKENVTPF